MRSALDRFWEKVDLSAGPEGCWVWRHAVNRKGYGEFWYQGQMRRAHRFAYEALAGPIPPGLQIDHLCRNHLCVNPVHMEPVTAHENFVRGQHPSNLQSKSKTCLYGHPFDRKWGGHRRCRRCRAVYQRRYRARKKAGLV